MNAGRRTLSSDSIERFLTSIGCSFPRVDTILILKTHADSKNGDNSGNSLIKNAQVSILGGADEMLDTVKVINVMLFSYIGAKHL